MSPPSLATLPTQDGGMFSTAIFKKKNPDSLKSKQDFLREEVERFTQVQSMPESLQSTQQNKGNGFSDVYRKLYDSLTVQVIEDSINVTLYNPQKSVLGPITQ